MALRGISFKETEEVILKSDPAHPDNEKPEGTPTIFIIGNLTYDDRIELGDMSTVPVLQGADVSDGRVKGGSIALKTQRIHRAYEAVRRALKGWKNLQDQDGNDIPFKDEVVSHSSVSYRKMVSEASLNCLTQSIIIELADEILRRNGVEDELLKKLEQVSPQSGETLSTNGTAEPAQNSNKSKGVASSPQ